jgi:tRNA dimethylallyltransferase
MPADRKLPKLIAVVGPTASGKTDLAVALAKKLRGEIISADSRQFYRGTEIGSDIILGRWIKRGRRRVYLARGIPHYGIAIRPPDRQVTIAEFQSMVVRLAKDINRRGRLPILAGGSGLYIRAVVDNFAIPQVPPQPAIRARLAGHSTTRLFRMLSRRDPEYARRIPPQNRRFLTRALEVIEVTGLPFSAQQMTADPVFDVLQIGIRRPRRQIYRRIEDRVDRQMDDGLLEEAARLGKRHGWDLPVMSGLGHRQLGLYLQGQTTLEEAVRLIKRDTRHFAKRQMTWFRRDKRIHWVKNYKEALRLVNDHLSK